MTKMIVSAKLQNGDPYSVEYNFGDNLEEAVEIFGNGNEQAGKELVFNKFRAAAIIDLQSFMRTQIKKEDFDPSTLQSAVDEWQPGMRAKGRSTSEKIQDLFAKLSAEEKEAFLAQLRGEAA